MIAAGVTLWFILGILGVALDFSNPPEDAPNFSAGQILVGAFGPIWFLVVVLWLILAPAPVRKGEGQCRN